MYPQSASITRADPKFWKGGRKGEGTVLGMHFDFSCAHFLHTLIIYPASSTM